MPFLNKNQLMFTSPEHWTGDNNDPADKDHLKPLSEQVAKTPKGRIMQIYAEEVRDNADFTLGADYEKREEAAIREEEENLILASIKVNYSGKFDKNGEPILESHVKPNLSLEQLLELEDEE